MVVFIWKLLLNILYIRYFWQVLSVDPAKDTQWKNLQLHVETDGVHKKDRINPNILTPGRSMLNSGILCAK